MKLPHAELQLARIAADLGALGAGGPLSPAEVGLVRAAAALPKQPSDEKRRLRRAIADGSDPLGERLCDVRTPEVRRTRGAFYTDPQIVDAMMRWVAQQNPDRVIDCGAGSGRFALAACRLQLARDVIAVEQDPLACLILRANAATRKVTTLRVINDDFMRFQPPVSIGRTAYVGNPPYVRHHTLDVKSKKYAQGLARQLGITLSGLSGLHAHFLIRVASLVHAGDVLCFITSAEWLDVNYGKGVRDLLVDGLRAEHIHVLDAQARAFSDAATTASIICARAGGVGQQVRFKTAASVRALTSLGSGGHDVALDDLRVGPWSRVALRTYAPPAAGSVPLGSLARVHRGIVTGANEFFVMSRDRARELGIAEWTVPVITSAEEVFEAGGIIRSTPERKVLLSPPSATAIAQHSALRAYLAHGEKRGLDRLYVPAHRSPWWRPHMKLPPPIVATYMARQAPAFALNPDGLAMLNVIHGIYPRAVLSAAQVRELVDLLNEGRGAFRGHGRTYHGGLEKFEPREMERLELQLPSASRLSMLCDG